MVSNRTVVTLGAGINTVEDKMTTSAINMGSTSTRETKEHETNKKEDSESLNSNARVQISFPYPPSQPSKKNAKSHAKIKQKLTRSGKHNESSEKTDTSKNDNSTVNDKVINSNTRLFYSLSELRREFKSSLDIAGGNGGVNAQIKLDLDIIKKQSTQELYYTLELYCSEKHEIIANTSSMALSAQEVLAKATTPNLLESFFKKYGDSYINSVQYGRWIVVIIQIKFSSTEQLQKASSKIGASVGNVKASANIVSELEQKLSNQQYSIYLYTGGVDYAASGLLTSINVVDELVKKFTVQGQSSEPAQISWTHLPYEYTISEDKKTAQQAKQNAEKLRVIISAATNFNQILNKCRNATRNYLRALYFEKMDKDILNNYTIEKTKLNKTLEEIKKFRTKEFFSVNPISQLTANRFLIEIGKIIEEILKIDKYDVNFKKNKFSLIQEIRVMIGRVITDLNGNKEIFPEKFDEKINEIIDIGKSNHPNLDKLIKEALRISINLSGVAVERLSSLPWTASVKAKIRKIIAYFHKTPQSTPSDLDNKAEENEIIYSNKANDEKRRALSDLINKKLIILIRQTIQEIRVIPFKSNEIKARTISFLKLINNIISCLQFQGLREDILSLKRTVTTFHSIDIVLDDLLKIFHLNYFNNPFLKNSISVENENYIFIDKFKEIITQLNDEAKNLPAYVYLPAKRISSTAIRPLKNHKKGQYHFDLSLPDQSDFLELEVVGKDGRSLNPVNTTLTLKKYLTNEEKGFLRKIYLRSSSIRLANLKINESEINNNVVKTYKSNQVPVIYNFTHLYIKPSLPYSELMPRFLNRITLGRYDYEEKQDYHVDIYIHFAPHRPDVRLLPTISELNFAESLYSRIETSNEHKPQLNLTSNQNNNNLSSPSSSLNKNLSDDKLFLDTLGDGNCFFHAAFGEEKNGEYVAENADRLRLEAYNILNQYNDINDQHMPKAFRDSILSIFDAFLNKLPEEMLSFYDLQEQTLNNITEANDRVKDLSNKIGTTILSKYNENMKFIQLDAVKKILMRYLKPNIAVESNISSITPLLNLKIEALDENAINALDEKTIASEYNNIIRHVSGNDVATIVNDNIREYVMSYDPSSYPNSQAFDNNCNPNVIKQNFTYNSELLRFYFKVLSSKRYYIYACEIGLFSSLSGTSIDFFVREQNQEIKCDKFKPVNTTEGKYIRKIERPWNNQKHVAIYHNGLKRDGEPVDKHYSRANLEPLKKLVASKEKKKSSVSHSKSSIFNSKSKSNYNCIIHEAPAEEPSKLQSNALSA